MNVSKGCDLHAPFHRPVLPTDLTSCPCLCPDLGAEGVNLLDDETLHALNGVLLFEAEIERLRESRVSTAIEILHSPMNNAHGCTDGLVSGVVPDGEVWVVQRLFARDALGGVEVEELGEEVDSERVGTREEGLEGHARLDGE